MRVAVILLFVGADAGAPSRGLDPHNCGALQVVSPLAGDLAAVAFSPDGRLCAIGGTGGVVRVYDASRWRETREIKLGEKVVALGFLPDGRRLVAAGEASIRVLDAEEAGEPRKFAQLFGATRSMALSPDGQGLLAGHADGRVSTWDVERGESRIAGPPQAGAVLATAFSREGGRAAISAQGGEPVRILKTGQWQELRILEPGEEAVSALVFTRDGRSLLCGYGSGGIGAWDVERGAATRVLQGHGGPVVSLSLTPDDLHAISGSSDGTIRLWDWRKGAELAQLKHEGVRAIALHPSGRMFASVGSDRQLRVWGYVRGGGDRPRTKGFCGISFVRSGGAVVVSSLVPGGPADQAGLKEGDVIRVIGTKAMKEPAEALEAIGSYGDGEEAVFEIERKGEEKQVRVRMGKKPGQGAKRP